MTSSIQPSLSGTAPGFRDAIKPVVVLGWPMILTQLFIMGTGFVDTVMAGRYSATDLAAVSLAGNVLWPAFMLLTGITMALSPIASQLRGASKTAEIGYQVRQGLWLCLANGVILVTILLNADVLFALTNVEPIIASIAYDYLRAISWGIPPIILYVALRHTSEGLGLTRPPMIIAGSVLPLNALLNYAFVYGNWGAPELGGVGCGWATAIVFWVQLACMLLVLGMRQFTATGLFASFDAPHPRALLKILQLGVPIGISIFLETAMFAVVSFLIAALGVVPMAAHSIAGNLNWLTYVIPMGMGAAASIQVGFLVGRGDLLAARITAYAVLKFAVVYALVVSVLLIVLRLHLVQIYTTDIQVIEVAATLLILIAVYQLVDDTQAVMIGALRGYKDTTVPMVISLVGYWVLALPLGYALAIGAFTDDALGVYGYWLGITAGLATVAMMVALRLRMLSADPEKIHRMSRQSG
jgi:MATE family multidrug resistance protein